MYENLGTVIRTARKPHKCDWCNETIEKGERYNYQKFIWDGEIRDWKSHEACNRVVSAIWEYADPDEGLDSDGFYEYGTEVCQKFVCPDCEKWDEETEDCVYGTTMCIDKMDKFFETYELYETREGYYRVFRCRKKKAGETNGHIDKRCT